MLTFDEVIALNQFRLLQQNEQDALARDIIKSIATPADKRLALEISEEYKNMGESTGLEVMLAIGLLLCQEME